MTLYFLTEMTGTGFSLPDSDRFTDEAGISETSKYGNVPFCNEISALEGAFQNFILLKAYYKQNFIRNGLVPWMYSLIDSIEFRPDDRIANMFELDLLSFSGILLRNYDFFSQV